MNTNKTNWNVDPTHSEIGFSVKHMMFSTVRGTFNDFSGSLEAEEGLKNAKLKAEIQVSSVDTRNEQRDEHLKGTDFFDAEKFPTIRFESTLDELKSGKVVGEFEMHGHKQSLPLEIEFHGEALDPWGNTRAALSFTTEINRKDYGLTWNSALETGGVLVGENVKLHGDIQLVKA